MLTGEVPIPKGFYYVGGTEDGGLVISDNSADAGKGTSHEVAQTLQGNQFVWVPVEEPDEFKTRDGYYNGKKVLKEKPAKKNQEESEESNS